MPYAQAGEVRLHYEVFGSAMPFLFVSGTGWPGEPWKLKQMPAFPDRYRVIVFDHCGVVKSDAPKGPYSTRRSSRRMRSTCSMPSVSTSRRILSAIRWGGECANGW